MREQYKLTAVPQRVVHFTSGCNTRYSDLLWMDEIPQRRISQPSTGSLCKLVEALRLHMMGYCYGGVPRFRGDSSLLEGTASHINEQGLSIEVNMRW